MNSLIKNVQVLGFLPILLCSCLAHKSDEIKTDSMPSALLDNDDVKETPSKDYTKTQDHLLTRVNALENQIIKQNQKIRLLEKNLKNEHQKQNQQNLTNTVKKKSDILENLPRTTTVSKNLNLPKPYESRIQEAKALYNKHIWQKAYISFSQIDREFNTSITKGETLYWMGMCWYRMKEYDSAKSLLKNFIANYPKHDLEYSARLYLAKAYAGMGQSREAMSTLRKLVRMDPDGQNTADAKQLLKKLENENL